MLKFAFMLSPTHNEQMFINEHWFFPPEGSDFIPWFLSWQDFLKFREQDEKWRGNWGNFQAVVQGRHHQYPGMQKPMLPIPGNCLCFPWAEARIKAAKDTLNRESGGPSSSSGLLLTSSAPRRWVISLFIGYGTFLRDKGQRYINDNTKKLYWLSDRGNSLKNN